ncbi:Cenp-O kinetochore centromere component-domain-containing protein [Podospora fimiseda]|uniref:Cenp-O kinetochore centromere component-domain-containing protein n=1 Tax=Podospora fimiseda TaxID=252190 RepID=A0AAN7H2D7_9PEZI|nr:Cenp-O kinetochore centromere component-domain-containing protein [Podospora fimiseda]
MEESTPTPAQTLEDEISDLQTKLTSLKSQLSLQTSTLLSAPSTRSILPPQSPLLTQSNTQQSHNLQSLYRACASITTFRARDPDPNSVDNGSILGLRIDVVSRTKFLRPYYVLLNRPYPGSKHLRIHRHTVPPCIPLSGLAARYLPSDKEKKQDLVRFAKVLRREVTRYHHRLGVVADLREAAVGEEIVEVSAVDAEAKQVSFEWADGRIGRLVMGDDGEVEKLVVVVEGERDRETGRELLGGKVDVQEIVRRLSGGL